MAGYQDETLSVTEEGLTIPRYYFPTGRAKRVAFADILRVERRPIGVWTGRWRIWGSGDLRTWWPLDIRRPRASECLLIELKGKSWWRWIALTPRDATAAAAEISARL